MKKLLALLLSVTSLTANALTIEFINEEDLMKSDNPNRIVLEYNEEEGIIRYMKGKKNLRPIGREEGYTLEEIHDQLESLETANFYENIVSGGIFTFSIIGSMIGGRLASNALAKRVDDYYYKNIKTADRRVTNTIIAFLGSELPIKASAILGVGVGYILNDVQNDLYGEPDEIGDDLEEVTDKATAVRAEHVIMPMERSYKRMSSNLTRALIEIP